MDEIDWVALHGLPALAVSGAQLDELELLLGGVNQSITLNADHASVLRDARATQGLVLTDLEGVPLGLVADSALQTGPELHLDPTDVVPLRPPEHGPFRSARTPARDVAPDGPYEVWAFRSLPSTADVAALDRASSVEGDRSLLVALMGAGSPVGSSVAELVKGVRALAAERAVSFVAVPFPARQEETEDQRARRLTQCLRAYGAGTVHEIPTGGSAFDGSSGHRPREGNGGRGLVILLTGLSGSGKSTIARGVVDALEAEDRHVTLLDGDEVRRFLSSDLGFSRADRDLNVRRIGWVASLVAGHGGVAVCAPIAPYAASRAEVRTMAEAVGSFLLVHVSTPLEVCEARDRKGLYARARAGLLPSFTGVSDPYEVPEDADVTVDTSTTDLDGAVRSILTAVGTRTSPARRLH